MTNAQASERIEQLHEGTVGAAAALPERHAKLGEEAVEAADRLRLLARKPSGAAAPGEVDRAGVGGATDADLDAALDALEAVHMDLLRIKIRGAEPPELDVEGGLERLRERIRTLEAGDG